MDLLGSFFGGPNSPSPSDAARLTRIEKKVDMILAHLGLEYSAAVPAGSSSDQVKEYIRQGNKLAAIKAYREENNASLRDAKDAVEAIMDDMAR